MPSLFQTCHFPPFQFLIGILKTLYTDCTIIRVGAVSIPYRYSKNTSDSQECYEEKHVSIPYRYSKNPTLMALHDIGTEVSIPYRYSKN